MHDQHGVAGSHSGETIPPISYERSRPPRDFFAARFAVFASIGILAGIACALLEMVFGIGLSIVAISGAEVVPISGFVYVFLGLFLDGLLLVGSVGSLFRAAWARRMLIVFANGQIVVVWIVLATLWWQYPWRALTSDPFRPVRVTAYLFVARLAYAALIKRIYRDIRADLYFHRDALTPTTVVPLIEMQAAAQRADGTPPKSPNRYRVSGVEIGTKRDVTFLSKAASESLARKSAAFMDLEPDSIVVEPIQS